MDSVNNVFVGIKFSFAPIDIVQNVFGPGVFPGEFPGFVGGIVCQ